MDNSLTITILPRRKSYFSSKLKMTTETFYIGLNRICSFYKKTRIHEDINLKSYEWESHVDTEMLDFSDYKSVEQFSENYVRRFILKLQNTDFNKIR